MSLLPEQAELVPSVRARPGAASFALMFALESITRSLLVSIIPLQAYAIMGAARDVSLAVLAVGLTGVIASFVIPNLIRLFGRRRVYPFGAFCLLVASGLLATETLEGQIAGMLVRVFGTACLATTLYLYILDHIEKRDLVRSEPMRLLFSALAWVVGPTLGVTLYSRFGHWPAYALSACCALLVLGNFWRLRLQDDPAVRRAKRPPPNPVVAIGRFVLQPRLRLGWTIAFGRSCFWTTFMTYGPLYVVRSGADPFWASFMVSMSSCFLFLTPVWGRIGARLGLRRTIVVAFAGTGVAMLLAALGAPFPLVAAAMLLAASLGGTCLDAVGNIPFMRAVHSYERPEMVTVFRTNVDLSDLATSLVFAVVLSFFDIPAAFLATGLACLVFASLSRYVPRSM